MCSASGRTDPQRTGKKREQIRAARLRLPLQLVNGPLLDGAKRLFELPHAVGKALDVTDGSMVEIVTAQGAALRGWAKFVDGREKVVRIDPTSLAILALKPNDLVEVRRLLVCPPRSRATKRLSMTTASYIVGIDVGGTFTDILCYGGQGNQLLSAKIPSVPGSQWRGVLGALDALGIDLGSISAFVHGTTIATNTSWRRRVPRPHW